MVADVYRRMPGRRRSGAGRGRCNTAQRGTSAGARSWRRGARTPRPARS